MMNKKPFKSADGPYIMLIAFAWMLLAQLIFSIIIMFATDDTAYEIANYIAMLAFQAVFITVYLTYTKKNKIKSFFSPRNKLTPWSIFAAVSISLIAFFGFIGPAYGFEVLLEKTGYSSTDIESSSVFSMVLIVLATVIAAPICEETIYRSALLSGFKRAGKGDIVAAFLSGGCFALMHINPSQTVYQFLLGTAAAYIVLKSGNVICSMIIHSISNLMAILISFTSFGQVIDGFYAQVESSVLYALLLCLLFPAVAASLIFLICYFVKKAEGKKYPSKFNFSPKVIWIDEDTKEPLYEGEDAPVVTKENAMMQRGFNPYTGEPVMVDRLELQKALMYEFENKRTDRAGKLGKKTYETSLMLYFIVTSLLWLFTFAAGFII